METKEPTTEARQAAASIVHEWYKKAREEKEIVESTVSGNQQLKLVRAIATTLAEKDAALRAVQDERDKLLKSIEDSHVMNMHPAYAASNEALRTKLRERDAENQKLQHGWSRIKDLLIAGHGPEECFRFKDAATAEKGKCVETVIHYINDLIASHTELRTERDRLKAEVERLNGEQLSRVSRDECLIQQQTAELSALRALLGEAHAMLPEICKHLAPTPTGAAISRGIMLWLSRPEVVKLAREVEG